MGCACVVTNKVSVTSCGGKIDNMGKIIKEKKNYFQATSPKNWAKICDFLKYKHLVEVSKLNR
jgi:hypothetical protein